MIDRIMGALLRLWTRRVNLTAAPAFVIASIFLFVPAFLLAANARMFERIIRKRGLAQASRWIIRCYYSGISVYGRRIPDRGPLLVVCNHPGLGDANALVAAMEREDFKIVVTENELYPTMPRFSSHLITIPEDKRFPVSAFRAVLSAFRRGEAVVLFPAGRVEFDPAFIDKEESLLRSWSPLVGFLCLQAAKQRIPVSVLPVMISNVYSRHAFNNWLVRMVPTPERKVNRALLNIILAGAAKRQRVSISVGEPVPSEDLLPCGRDPAAITEVVRAELRRIRRRHSRRALKTVWRY